MEEGRGLTESTSRVDREKIIRNLCRKMGMEYNLHYTPLSEEELESFQCATEDEFKALVIEAMKKMKEVMVGREIETLAIECALALDGGEAVPLQERRAQFLCSEDISERTLIRKEVRGAQYLVRTMDVLQATRAKSAS